MRLMASWLVVALAVISPPVGHAASPADPDPFDPTVATEPQTLEAPDPFALDQPPAAGAEAREPSPPSPPATNSDVGPTAADAPLEQTSTPAPVAAPPPPAPQPIMRPPADGGAGDRAGGIVMTVFAAASFAAGVGMQLTHGHRLTRCFEHAMTEQVTTSAGWGALGRCERNERGWRWGARVFLTGVPIFALTGGSALGRGRAQADAVERERVRSTGLLSSLGGTFIGLGVMGLVASNTVLMFDEVKNRCAHIGFVSCARYNHLMISGGNDLSVLVLSSGVLMLASASAYRRSARRYGLTFVPTLGLGYAGLGVAGRFGG